MGEWFARAIRSSFLALAVLALAVITLVSSALVVGAFEPDPGGESTVRDARGIPPIVFVSRTRPTGKLHQSIPGFGLEGRTLAVGGRLLVRAADGGVRELVPSGALYDASDPAVSWDGKRIVFAGLAHPDSAWRLYLVRADGSGLTPLTYSDRAIDVRHLGPGAGQRFARYDDFDPAWLPDGRIVFASTRFPQIAQQGGFLVSNLFVVRSDGTGLERLTSERNGGEEPTIDPPTGRIVYSRWLFNPYLPSDQVPGGLTLDRARALPMERIDQWQTVSIFPDGDRIQLAAGDPGDHPSLTSYQPCVLRDGSLAAIVPSESPSALVSFRNLLAWYPPGVGPRRGGIGPGAIDAIPRDASFRGAASPAALPDGRIAYAADQQGTWSETGPAALPHDDMGIYVVNPTGGPVERILDLPGTDELDPAPLIKRKVPPVIGPQGGIDDPAWTLPVTRLDQVRRGHDTLRFDDLNVFATGPVDSPFPDAPKIANKVRIRFFAALARPEAATGDTVVLVREAKLEDSGAVHESDIPGDVPMFEQLVDDLGHVLRSSRAPAHGPGFNFARTGAGTKCIGCHAGHSALPVPKNYLEAKWFNASTSAEATVSGGSGGAHLVDRRAKGPIAATGWVAGSEDGPWARLKWAIPIEAKALVLYAPTPDGAAGTDLQVKGCDVVLLRDGREVGHASAGRVRPQGTRVEFPPARIDAIELRNFRVEGRVERRPTVALAEIETIARLIE